MVNIKSLLEYHSFTINYSYFISFALGKSAMPSINSSLKITDYQKTVLIPFRFESRYLGVTLDSNLKWKSHIKGLVTNLRGLIARFEFLVGLIDISIGLS